jgi:hypothetical protein
LSPGPPEYEAGVLTRTLGKLKLRFFCKFKDTTKKGRKKKIKKERKKRKKVVHNKERGKREKK